MLGRVFPPAALEMLSNVLTKHCEKFPRTTVDEKEQMAVQLITMFESGENNPVVLADSLATMTVSKVLADRP